MPSVLVGNQSGGQPIVSGNPWSGQNPVPQGGIQLRWDGTASGYLYVGLSGNLTVASGGLYQSGSAWSGMLDGMQLSPGDTYWIPRIATGISGNINIFVTADAAASGQGRLYWEAY